MNSIGQTPIALCVETCSFADPMLVEAHRRQREVSSLYGHKKTELVKCDNPHKDGPGLLEAVLAGDGKAALKFPGVIELVESETECDDACEYLSQFKRPGFDTEWVAYVNGGGVNSDKAAIGQLCGDGKLCYIFLFYKWAKCYSSFSKLMADASISKVALNHGGDVAKLEQRFASPRGDGLKLGGVIELSTLVANLNLKKHDLKYMVRRVMNQYLAKAIDHRRWEAPGFLSLTHSPTLTHSLTLTITLTLTLTLTLILTLLL